MATYNHSVTITQKSAQLIAAVTPPHAYQCTCPGRTGRGADTAQGSLRIIRQYCNCLLGFAASKLHGASAI